MKCIILLVIFAMAQHEGVTGLPQHDFPTITTRSEEREYEEIYKLLEDSRKYGHGLYRDNLIARYIKWDDLKTLYQQLKQKFEDFVHDLTHDFLPEKIATHNTTQTNVTPTVSTPDKPTNNHQPTPVKIDDKEAKPEDNNNSLTSQNPASSEETQEKGTQTSLTPDKSTVNQESTLLEYDDKEEEPGLRSIMKKYENLMIQVPLHRIRDDNVGSVEIDQTVKSEK